MADKDDTVNVGQSDGVAKINDTPRWVMVGAMGAIVGQMQRAGYQVGIAEDGGDIVILLKNCRVENGQIVEVEN